MDLAAAIVEFSDDDIATLASLKAHTASFFLFPMRNTD
jgi:hypothetical protein